MHVVIDRSEQQRGIFRRKTEYDVTCTITFSEEEKAIIRKARLSDHYAFLFKIRYHGEMVDHGKKFKELFKPHTRTFDFVSEADDWERALKELHIPTMKRILEKEKGGGTSSTSFEV